MMKNELCIPAAAVSVAGGEGEGGGAAVAPGVGDSVEAMIQGTVSRVEGGNVYVTPATANGMPIEPVGMMGGSEYGGEGDELDRLMKEEAV